jgi:hypothetical protein
MTDAKKDREDILSFDWMARNLSSHACPLLATDPSLSHFMLAGVCRKHCMFSLVVFKIHTSTVVSVVTYEYSVQK